VTGTSAVPAVIGYLIDTFTAASTLGTAATPVSIRCGPELSGDFSQLALFVGVDDPTLIEAGSAATAATSNQTWVGMGARARDEDISIFCTAEAWSGETGTRAAMTAVYGIVAAVETLLAADVYLGGMALFQAPGSTSHTLKWLQGNDGLAAHVSFRIDAKARLGGP
jgi:hypothetical protein